MVNWTLNTKWNRWKISYQYQQRVSSKPGLNTSTIRSLVKVWTEMHTKNRWLFEIITLSVAQYHSTNSSKEEFVAPHAFVQHTLESYPFWVSTTVITMETSMGQDTFRGKHICGPLQINHKERIIVNLNPNETFCPRPRILSSHNLHLNDIWCCHPWRHGQKNMKALIILLILTFREYMMEAKLQRHGRCFTRPFSCNFFLWVAFF